jgi:very-short-patch-repair endonuclease
VSFVSANADGWRPFVFFSRAGMHVIMEMDWWIHPPSANKNKIRQSILSTDGFIIGKKI